jgi:hypothetical protein
MYTPEHLINDLKKEITKLKEELEVLKLHIVDFEKLAIEWKNGHEKLKRKSKLELAHSQQIIEELQKELNER